MMSYKKFKVKARSGDRCDAYDRVVLETNDLSEARSKIEESNSYYLQFTNTGLKEVNRGAHS